MCIRSYMVFLFAIELKHIYLHHYCYYYYVSVSSTLSCCLKHSLEHRMSFIPLLKIVPIKHFLFLHVPSSFVNTTASFFQISSAISCSALEFNLWYIWAVGLMSLITNFSTGSRKLRSNKFRVLANKSNEQLLECHTIYGSDMYRFMF